MAEPASIFDQLDEDAEAAAVAKARAELAAGRGVPHERVAEWLARLAEGEDLPPPTA